MTATKLKTKSIFDFLTCLFTTKTKWDDLSESDKKAFSPYMINRFISMDSDYIGVVNYLQQYTISGMSNREVYKLYLDLLPKRKFFAKYIKAKNTGADKFSSNLVEFISNREKWAIDETIDNLSFITTAPDGNDILKDYLKLYGISADEAWKTYKIK